MSSTNAPWLDLQDLYSSINYLKAKLNAADQKLRAASLEEPVQVDCQGIPRMAVSPLRASQEQALGIGARRDKAQTRKQQVQQCGSATIKTSLQDGCLIYVDPVCINGDARRGFADPFSCVAGLQTRGSLLEGQQHVPEDHCVNQGAKDRGHVSRRSSRSRMDKVRKIIEKQKRDADKRSGGQGEGRGSCGAVVAERVRPTLTAEDAYGTATLPHFPSSTNADGVKGIYDWSRVPSKLQNVDHEPRTREVTFAENVFRCLPVPLCGTNAAASGTEVLQHHLHSGAKDWSASDHLQMEQRNTLTDTRRASESYSGTSDLHTSRTARKKSTSLCTNGPDVDGGGNWRSEKEMLGDFYIDDYLRCIGSRKGKESKSRKELNVVTQAAEASVAVLLPSSRKQELSVTEVPRVGAEDVEPAVLKRKVVLVPKVKEYPGSRQRSAARIERKIRRIAPKPPPATMPFRRPPEKNTVLSVKATSTTDAKKNAIAATSSKEGQHFVPKKRVPPPAMENEDTDVQEHADPGKERREADTSASKENTSLENFLVDFEEEAGAPANDDQVEEEKCPGELEKAAVDTTRRSVPHFGKSTKRKAQQLHTEKTEQSPAPKVRHYDSSAVRKYIKQQRLLRKRQEQDTRRSLAEASAAKEHRLKSLYAFQRKTASTSAKIGRQKSLNLQKEQEKEAAFLQSCKAQEDTESDENFDDSWNRETDVADPSDSQDRVPPTGKLEIASQTEVLPVEGRASPPAIPDSRRCSVSSPSEASSGGSSPPKPDNYVVDRLRELLRTAETEKPIPVSEFKYEPTPQLRHIRQLTIDIDRAINEELENIGYSPMLQRPNTEPKTADIASRLHQALDLFDPTRLLDLPVLPSLQSMQTDEAGPNKLGSESPVSVDVKDQAVRRIQRCYRQFRLRKHKALPQDKKSTTRDAGTSTKPLREQERLHKGDLRVTQVAPQEPQHQDVHPPMDTAAKSEASEDSFFHLVPDSYTFARAWKLKNLKREFMTSTQSEGRFSPNFSVSSLEGDSVNKTAKKQQECDDTEWSHQQHGDDTVISITLITDELNAAAAPHKPERPDETDVSVTAKPLSGSQLHASSGNVAPDGILPAATDTGKLQQSQKLCREMTNQAELSGHSSDAFHHKGKSSSKVWQLLGAQAEAVRASAEAARRLAEVRGPSLLQQQSEDLTRLLTASTVAAASALAASLTAQQGAQTRAVSIPVISAEQQTEPWKRYVSTAIEYTEPSSTSWEEVQSIENSATMGSSETVSEEVASTGSSETNNRSEEHDVCGASEDGKAETSQFVSEQLVASEGTGSSRAKERLKVDISRKKQATGAHLESPISTDQESNNVCDNGLSSTSDPIILDKSLLSFSSLTDSYFVTSALPNCEKPQLALLCLQEKSLVQKTRAELAWLEVLKRKCRECGADDRVPALRKKQRGLLLKLHQKCAQLKFQQQKFDTEDHMQPVALTRESRTSTPTNLDSSVSEELVNLSVLSATSKHQESVKASMPDTTSRQEASDEAGAVNTEQQGTSSDAASISSKDAQEKSALFSLGASKRTLKEWQQQLAKRRKCLQDMLEWQKKLNIEEAKVRALERQVINQLKVVNQLKVPSSISGHRSAPAGSWETHSEEALTAPATEEISSKFSGDLLLEGRHSSSVEEAVLEETATRGPYSITESVEEEEGDETEKKSKTSVPASETYSSSFEKDAKSTNEGCTNERLSSSREQRSPLNRGLIIRSPLLPVVKARRDSSGSEDSFNVSYSETPSEQSDVEGQILALREELKRRQLEAARLKKEQKRRCRELLQQKEQVLRKHIEMYDQLIEDAKAELEKEKIQQAVSVKPQIKKPCIAEQQKRLSSDAHSSHSLSASLSIKTALPSEEYSESKSPSTTSALDALSLDKATEKVWGASAGTGHTSTSEDARSKVDALKDISEQLSDTREWQGGHSSEGKGGSNSKISSFQHNSDHLSCDKDSGAVPEELDTTGGVPPVCSLLSQSEVCDGPQSAESIVPGAQSASDIAESIPTDAESIPSSTENSENIPQSPSCGLPSAESQSQVSGDSLQSREGAVQVSGDAVCSVQSDLRSISEDQTGVSGDAEDEQPASGACVPPLSSSQDIFSDIFTNAGAGDRDAQDTSVRVDSHSASTRVIEAASEDDLSATEEVAEYTYEIVRGTFIMQPSDVENEKSALGDAKVDRMVDSILEYLCNETFTALKPAFSSAPVKSEEDDLLLQSSVFEDSVGPSTSEAAAGEEQDHFIVKGCTEMPQTKDKENFYKKEVDSSVDSKCEDGSLTQERDLRENDDDVEKRDRGQQAKPFAEGGTPVELEINSGGSDSMNRHGGIEPENNEHKEMSDILSCSEAKSCEPLRVTKREDTMMSSDEKLNGLVRKMVFDAVSSVLDIAKEKGLTSSSSEAASDATPKEKDMCKARVVLGHDASNVTKKVSSIMASLEQKRSHRELLRPQDMMVLSTDLDDDFFACKDSVALEQQGPPQEHNDGLLSSEEKENEEPHSRASQSDDCTPLAIEQDWFEDDFGLGSPFLGEQFAYPRQIPNKPPPPYSPPKGGSLLAIPKKPSGPATVVSCSEPEARAICRKSASLVFVAVVQGGDLDLLECNPLDILPKGEGSRSQVAEKSWCNFCRFLFDLSKEVARDIFSIAEVPLPPWQKSCSIRRKLPMPHDEGRFIDLVSEGVLKHRGTSSKRAAPAQLCPAARIRRRKRVDDVIDDEADEAVNVVLQREIREEEPEWVDYSCDEVAVKELVADAIFVYLLDDMIRVLRALECKR